MISGIQGSSLSREPRISSTRNGHSDDGQALILRKNQPFPEKTEDLGTVADEKEGNPVAARREEEDSEGAESEEADSEEADSEEADSEEAGSLQGQRVYLSSPLEVLYDYDDKDNDYLFVDISDFLSSGKHIFLYLVQS